MPAFSLPLPAGVALIVDAAGQPCATCGRVAALLVVQREGTELVTRCLACHAEAA